MYVNATKHKLRTCHVSHLPRTQNLSTAPALERTPDPPTGSPKLIGILTQVVSQVVTLSLDPPPLWVSPFSLKHSYTLKKSKNTQTAFVHRSLGNPSLLWNLLPQIRKPSILFSPSFLCAPCDWSTGYTHRGIEVSFAIHGQVQACLCPLDCHNPQSHRN